MTTLKTACLLTIAVAFSPVAVPSATDPDQAPAGSILGRVVTKHSRQPVADAVVQLTDGSRAVADAVRSTSEGWFLFTNVPPGAWTIGAVKAGHLATGNSGMRQSVRLAAGEHRTGVEVPLIQYGAISGSVIDEAGEPAIGITIRSYRVGASGFGRWVPSLSTTTDDRGQYRLYLTPGRYAIGAPSVSQSVPIDLLASVRQDDGPILAALERQPSLKDVLTAALEQPSTSLSAGDQLVSLEGMLKPARLTPYGECVLYPASFHPTGSAPEEARAISLSDGEQIEAVDIHLRPATGRMVSGKVVSPEGLPATVPVSLEPIDGAGRAVASTLTSRDGRFAFPCVPAGDYSVTVVQRIAALATGRQAISVSRAGERASLPGGARPALTPEDRVVWATTPLSVGTDDPQGVTVALHEGHRISGRVVFDDGVGPERSVRRVVGFWQAGPVDRYYSTDVEPDLTFRSPPLPAGRYYMSISASDGWALASLVVDGQDIADDVLDVGDVDLRDATVTVSNRFSTLSGTVANDADLDRARVMVFPADRSLWPHADRPNARRSRSVETTSEGSYRLDRVPPGDYFVVATDDTSDGDWRIPESLDRLARQADRVSIEFGRHLTKNLAVVRLDAVYGSPRRSQPAHTPPRPFAPPSSAAEPFDASTGSIAGRVLAADGSGRPIRAAIVTVSAVAARTTRTVVTDDLGRFAAAGLPPGRYRIAAAKPAHLTMEYGANRPGRPGTPVDVKHGDRIELDVPIPRGGVITGRVTTPEGHPLMEALVHVLSLKQTPDGPALHAVPEAMPRVVVVDDRGEYRVYNLPPGEYFVGVTGTTAAIWPGRPISLEALSAARSRSTLVGAIAGGGSRTWSDARPAMYAPAFHPGGGNIALARPVTVGIGEVRDAIDVRVDLEPAGRLRGRVVRPDGSPAGGVMLAVFPDGLRIPGGGQLGGVNAATAATDGGMARVTTAADGTFEARALPAPTYTLVARGPGESGAPAALWAIQSVAVNGDEVDDVVVPLQHGLDVTGRIIATGITRAAVQQIRVSLRGLLPGELAAEHPAAAVGADDSFAFAGVIPGRYLLGVEGLPEGWVAVSATIGGRDLLDTPVEIGPGLAFSGPLDLVVALSETAAELSGRFTDSDLPATDYYVILFSSDPGHWRSGSRRVRAVRPSADGRFVIDGLASGPYRVAVVTDVRQNEWHDSAFLSTLMPYSEPILLAPGQRATQDFAVKR